MKTTTAAFDLAWGNRRVRKGVYRITYKRRYWNGSAYVLESVAKTVPQREIDRIGAINWKLDVPFRNRILPSNVSITLLDKAYKWLPTNTANGVWRKDATATVGYEPVDSEFTLSYGYVLADGTTKLLSQFVGLVQDDPKFDSVSGTVTISLVGKSESKLERADAQNVCTTLTDQTTTPATGDGSNARFATAKSVWQADTIRVAAVAKTQGTHYTLDKLNDAEDEADIVFETAAIPTAGQAVLWNGRQWYRDKSISELVGLLCDESGISSGDRSIQEPIFAAVDQSSELTTEAHWAAGAGTNFDSSSLPGTLRRKWILLDKFDDNEFAASPEWTQRNRSDGAGVTSTADASSGALVLSHNSVAFQSGFIHHDTPLNFAAYGTWRFRFRSQGTAGANPSRSGVVFLQTGPGIAANAYGLECDWNLNVFRLVRYDGGVTAGPTAILTMGAADTSSHVWMISRTSAGLFTVYKDGVSQGTVTDNTYTTASQFGLYNYAADTALTVTTTLDDIYFAYSVETTDTATDSDLEWTSAEIDLLATPTAWLPLLFAHTLNGGTVTYKTRTAASSGGVYDAAVALDGTNTPTSTKRRYFKLVISTTRAAGAFVAPEIESVTINWRGQNLFIKSADFTGLTCLQAIQELAKIGGMEFGSEGDGTFFFRNKTVSGVPDLVLSQKNVILAVLDYQSGYRDVRTIAQVRYGTSGEKGYYFAEYKASDAGEASPTTAERFGDKVITMELTRFIFANDAQVAEAIAQKLYEENYRPKRKLKLRCRIIPQADLSDQYQISVHDSPLIEKAIFGDPLQKYPVTGPSSRTLARDLIMKVVGHSPDDQKSESVLDLEEVLS